jgi:hypothetical protein
MALDAAQVEILQNSEPTDWTKFDKGLMHRSPGEMTWPGPGDDKLHVKFYMKPRIDQAESDRQQRPVYKDTPYIEMMMPGEKNVIIREPVWDQHLKRFPAQWQQFLAGESEQVIGTPLKVAPFLTESQVEELAFFKIRTIEQLADLSDTGMNFMGANELKQAAKRFIEKTRGNDALLARIEALEAENRKLQAAQALERAVQTPPVATGRK